MTRFGRRLRARRDAVQAVYEGPWTPAAWRRIRLRERDIQISELVWQVCDQCEVAIVNKVAVVSYRQRRGLGRRLVLWAVRQAPGYTWVTTARSPDGDRLFSAVTEVTGLTFPATAQTCAHISDATTARTGRQCPGRPGGPGRSITLCSAVTSAEMRPAGCCDRPPTVLGVRTPDHARTAPGWT